MGITFLNNGSGLISDYKEMSKCVFKFCFENHERIISEMVIYEVKEFYTKEQTNVLDKFCNIIQLITEYDKSIAYDIFYVYMLTSCYDLNNILLERNYVNFNVIDKAPNYFGRLKEYIVFLNEYFMYTLDRKTDAISQNTKNSN